MPCLQAPTADSSPSSLPDSPLGQSGSNAPGLPYNSTSGLSASSGGAAAAAELGVGPSERAALAEVGDGNQNKQKSKDSEGETYHRWHCVCTGLHFSWQIALHV